MLLVCCKVIVLSHADAKLYSDHALLRNYETLKFEKYK